MHLPAKGQHPAFHVASLFLILSSNGLKVVEGRRFIPIEIPRYVMGAAFSKLLSFPEPSALSHWYTASKNNMQFCHIDILTSNDVFATGRLSSAYRRWLRCLCSPPIGRPISLSSSCSLLISLVRTSTRINEKIRRKWISLS